jgi:uncharacterized repeat protein (TIGR01451 family)
LKITDNRDPVRIGETFEYRLKLRNDCDRDRTVDVIAMLDEDTSFLSASDDGEEEDDDEVLWEDIDIDADDTVTLILRVRVLQSARDGQQLKLEGEADEAEDDERTLVIDDDRPPVNEETGTVTIDKSADRSEVQPGSMVSYTLTIRNSGHGIARDLRVEDRFTAGALTVEDPAGGQSAGNGIVWEIPVLGPNETRIIRYRVRVSPSMSHGQIISNTVQVTGLGFDRPATDTEQVNVIQHLPQTGIAGTALAASAVNDRVRLSGGASGSDASVPFVIWSTIITMGLSVGSVLGRRMFL